MKFIHAADLHIDSPLRGLEFDDSSRSQRIRRATRDAFSNLLSLAITEQVDFIIIAGDLFDGEWPDMRTGLWTAEQFRRLREHDIRVYMIRGNHDAVSVVAPSISWPKEVVWEFDAKTPQSLTDPRSGAVLHGQSYADRRAPGDLAAKYPAAVAGAFNIGVLHTSLEGDANHATYAPTRRELLAARGYDYWALGHIHKQEVLQTKPHIVYSGNTQGRHIKETGPKGCYLVTVNDGQINCAFHATDVIRWQLLDVKLTAEDDEPRLFDRLTADFEHALAAASGRPVVVRLTLRGGCQVHEQLASVAARARMLAEIRNVAANCGDLWIEQIDIHTRPPVDLDELRKGGDVVGELLRSLDEYRRQPAKLLELRSHLQPLFDKAGDLLNDGQNDVNCEDPAQLGHWLDQAESQLLGELLGDET